MSDMEIGVVIPVGAGRRENLLQVLACIQQQTVQPKAVVLICDGPEAGLKLEGEVSLPLAIAQREKHQPGMTQPRNVGVQILDQMGEFTHVYFMDTDIIIEPDCIEQYVKAMQIQPEQRIMAGPYDWLPPGIRQPVHDRAALEAWQDVYRMEVLDGRWARFDEAYPWTIYKEDLSAGLACFSGNLVWPIKEFKRVGGFWNELHHGRCEDGELGLRAAYMGVPISFISEARGWHLHHDRDIHWIGQTNAIDVPKINNKHKWLPWLKPDGLTEEEWIAEDQGRIFVVEEDGRRFNWRCPVCQEDMNAALMWAHQTKGCPGAGNG